MARPTRTSRKSCIRRSVRSPSRLPELGYNTAIAALMEYLNVVRGGGRTARRAEVEPLVVMLAPFAPHIAEELYQRLGHNGGLFDSARWPEFDAAKAAENSVEIAVQVNGKLRARLVVAVGAERGRREIAGDAARERRATRGRQDRAQTDLRRRQVAEPGGRMIRASGLAGLLLGAMLLVGCGFHLRGCERRRRRFRPPICVGDDGVEITTELTRALRQSGVRHARLGPERSRRHRPDAADAGDAHGVVYRPSDHCRIAARTRGSLQDRRAPRRDARTRTLGARDTHLSRRHQQPRRQQPAAATDGLANSRATSCSRSCAASARPAAQLKAAH